jgi:hypothetical protein
MASNLHSTIQRGNGVNNDNLAALEDILIKLHGKTHDLEKTVEETNLEIISVRDTITKIDTKNARISSWSFYLLIATTILSMVGVFIAYLSLNFQ